MNEIIVAHDPVKLTLSWLTGQYPWPVTLTKNRPNPITGRVVTVRRTGGTPGTLITDPAWLSIETYAPTDDDCAQLAHLTWGLVAAMAGEVIDGIPCYRVQTLGAPADMPLTDPGDMQRPRYVMSTQVSFRQHAI